MAEYSNETVPDMDEEISYKSKASELEELVNELRRLGELHRKRRVELSTLNEEYYEGRQNQLPTVDGSSLVDVWADAKVYPTVHNYIRPVVDTIAARLTKNRPNVKATPSTPEARDIVSSGVADAIITSLTRSKNFDDVMHKAVHTAYIHGTGGFKVYYDPIREEIVWDPITLFDFVIDPSSDSPQWVMFENYIPAWEARKILKAADIKAEVETVSYTRGAIAEPCSGVCVYELWYLPDERIKEGLFLQCVGGNVVGAAPYPPGYTRPHPDLPERIVPFLPVVLFKPLDHRGSPYGDTPMDSALEPQSKLNHLESVLAHLERLSGSIRWVGPLSVNRQMRSGNSHYIDITTPNEKGMMGWAETPQIPSLLMENRNVYVDRIYKLFGISEVSVGSMEMKSNIAAKGLAYMAELDGDKMAGASKGLSRAVLELWRKTLALMQSYYIVERVVALTGKGLGETILWKGAMLNGVDIDLVEDSSLQKHPDGIEADYAEKAKAGLLPPEGFGTVEATGLREDNFSLAQKRILDWELGQILEGKPLPELSADPGIAVEYLAQKMQIDPTNFAIIKQFMQLYDSKGKNAAAKQGPPPAPPGAAPVQ